MKNWKQLDWSRSKAFLYIRKSTLLFILDKIPESLFCKTRAFRRKIYAELSKRRKKGFNKITHYREKFVVFLSINKLREAKVEDYEPYMYRILPRKMGFVVEFKKVEE